MFTPERLTLARKRRGLTQIRLAEQCGFSKSLLEKLERGAMAASPEILAALMRALEVPAGYFEAPPLAEIPVGAASFRALTKMTAAERDAALAAGAHAIEFSEWMTVRFGLPPPSLPDLSGLEPEIAAEALRAEWHLGDAPLSNVVHLLEQHGCRLFSLAQETQAVDAFSVWRNGTPYVFLNTQKSAERSRMDAAHELAHLVLHRHEAKHERDHETEANAFASAFLMPRSSLIAHAPRAPRVTALIEAKHIWKVSVVALAFRMHRLRLLSDWYYTNLCIEFSKRGFRKHEPEPTSRETSQVLGKVFQLLRQKGISRAQVAQELNMLPRDLDDLVFGLVIGAVT